MIFFPWKEEYSVGIASIDQQHKALVGIINELYDGMVDTRGEVTLRQVFEELIAYCSLHFEAEEELFELHGYAGAVAHRVEHEELTRRVLEYGRLLDAEGWVSPLAVAAFLKDWLSGHILHIDKGYSAFLVGKGVR